MPTGARRERFASEGKPYEFRNEPSTAIADLKSEEAVSC
jgi:hypothetical protein